MNEETTPLDTEPKINYTQYISVERYGGGAIYIHRTQLLELAEELKEYLVPLHQNALVNLMDKYRRDNRLSRTYHKQLLSMFRGYVPEWTANKTLGSQEAEVFAAITEAMWIDKKAEEMAGLEREKRKEGNVTIVKVEAK